MMKVIVTGGGTAGHINPAIAIAQRIRQQCPAAELLYVGAEKGMESELAPRGGFRFEGIAAKGFRRRLGADTLKTLATLFRSLGQAAALLKREKPALVIGTGGYVCGPLVLLAALRGCPTLIHEQNAVPGATNRILSRFVSTVCISYEDTGGAFARARRTVLTGNPVREEFSGLDRSACRQRLGIPADAFLVVSTGGSGGAAALNRAVKACFEKNRDRDIFWYHITGKTYYTEFIEGLPEVGAAGSRRVLAFSHEMPCLLGAADLAVSRAGALILAELAASGVPSLLVPSPNVANRHQDLNAQVCAAAGMSRILWEKELDGDRLWEAIAGLRQQPGALAAMGAAARAMHPADAADRILDEACRLVPELGRREG